MHLQTNDNRGLRVALDAPDGFDRFKHRAMVEAAKSVHPHTVVYREIVDESTCVTYALWLIRNKIYRAIAGNFGGKIFAGRKYVEWLLQGHLKELDRTQLGSLAFYFSDGVWQHVGAVSGTGRVTSQWGSFPVYEHDTFELPARYGDEVRYFEMLGRSEALQLFLEFSKSSGLSEDSIARVARNA